MDGKSPDSRVVYDTTPDGKELKLSIYRPATTKNAAPTIMYVHGGGWTLGTADQLSSELRQLADDGYLVISVEYELATPTKHTWDRTPDQINCAAAWIGQNAKGLGGSLNKLAFWGDSAGGNLALNAAYSARAGTATSPCGDVPAPQAVIADFPAVDVASVYDSNFDLAGLSAHTFATNYLGGTPTQYPERYKAIGTANFLSDKAPQTLLMIPERDELVPPSATYAWASKAERAGASVDLVKVPLAMHLYTQLAYNSIGSQLHLSIAEHYLQTHLR
jgi:acetyl esterase/lipase